MVQHILKLRQWQEELHIMGNLVNDEDFVMILLTSLPESWDNYTMSFLGLSGNKPSLKSHELVAMLYEEDRRRKTRNGETSTALQAKHNTKGGNQNAECYNCHKKGHLAADCWSKGGGKEGQGPKGRKKGKKGGHRANQAEEVNSNLNDCAYMVSEPHKSHDISKFDWLLDSGATSHICTVRDAFTDFTPTHGE